MTLKTEAPSGYCMERTRELVKFILFRDINGHYFVIESQWDTSFIIIDFYKLKKNFMNLKLYKNMSNKSSSTEEWNLP